MCKKLNLIIEVDGITHTFPGAAERDLVRQTKLENAGFTVIRFKDEEVLNQIKSVKQIIFDTVEKLENSPPPNPLKEGDK